MSEQPGLETTKNVLGGFFVVFGLGVSTGVVSELSGSRARPHVPNAHQAEIVTVVPDRTALCCPRGSLVGPWMFFPVVSYCEP